MIVLDGCDEDDDKIIIADDDGDVDGTTDSCTCMVKYFTLIKHT